MEKINVSTFKKWLNASDMRLIIDNGNAICRISKNISLVAKEVGDCTEYSQQVLGYNFLYDGTSISCETAQKVVETAQKFGFITDGLVTVKFINETFATYQDFLDDKNFKTATMKEILAKVPRADCFCLISDFKGSLSIEMAQSLLEKTISETLSRCKFIYENLTAEEVQKLPPFKTLLETIFIEWASTFTSQDSASDFEKFKRLTKSKQNDEILSSFYTQFNVLSECKISLDNAVNSTEKISLAKELDRDNNLSLKNALIDLELGFSSHSCVTTKLLKMFRFSLNEQTKKWLLNYENDYEIEGFYDLAFYCGEELLFSSRTAERQHILFKK